jgi:peptidyl-prolyl cis-trans isomerase SurA
MRKITIAAVVAAAVLAANAAFADPALIDRVVAVVGDDVVTLSELQTEMAAPLADINSRYRGDDLARAADTLKRNTLNSLVDKKVQLQEARLNGITVDKADLDAAINDIMKRNNMDEEQLKAALMGEGYTLPDYRKMLEDQLMIIRLVSAAVRSKVLVEDAEVDAYYDAHKDEYTRKESVRVANIFFPAKDGDMAGALEAANAAKAQITAGTPFEEMAVKCTGDEGAAKSCVLGTFGQGELSPAINDLAFRMKAGEVSEPVELKGGYQLVKVMERADESVQPLDEVRGKIADEISATKSETLYAKWIQDLRKRTYVEIRD